MLYPGHRLVPDVVFWTADRGGSRFYRCEQPAEALAKLGYEVEVTGALTETLRRARTVVGMRIVTPSQIKGWREIIGHRLPGQRFVFDGDDNYFAIDPENNPDVYRMYSSSDTQEILREALSTADMVTTCTGPLADAFATINPNVHITPNTLPVRLSRPGPVRRPAHPYTIGWAGSPSAHADLAMIAKPLRRWLDRDTMARLHLIGVPVPMARGVGLYDHPRIRVTEWAYGTERYIGHIDFDLWVAPYRQTTFNDSKYPTKIMEAAVLRIPLLASNVGQYKECGDGVTLVDNTETAWFNALRWCSPYQEWSKLATAARAGGERFYTECNTKVWERLLVKP